MITKLVLATVLLGTLAACVDFTGARKVTYTENKFYFRHYPVWIGDDEALALANEECEKIDKTARQDGADQFNVFDVRYVTFTCI
jgi:hypothetical protein